MFLDWPLQALRQFSISDITRNQIHQQQQKHDWKPILVENEIQDERVLAIECIGSINFHYHQFL